MRTLLLPLAVACSGPRDPNLAVDDVPEDSDTEAPAGQCSGTWSVDLSAGPTTFDVEPTTWELEGADLVVAGNGRGQPGVPSFEVSRDEEGCLVFAPGSLAIDLTDSGCAASSVELELTDRCGPACTEAIAAAGSERVASNATTTSDVPSRIQLAPAEPFTILALRTLHAQVCAIRFVRTEIPEALLPEDTDEDF